MKKYDITALGELLIDFTENGISEQGNTVFEANPGGAPCNVLAMLATLGKKAAFIGKVGDDMFGHQLAKAVKEEGIDIDGIIFDKSVSTTLAFVHTLEGGEREFSFVRNPGADMMLSVDDVKKALIADSKIFHFGTLSSTHEPVRSATRFAIDFAIESGAWISFDPNLRELLWPDIDNAREEMRYGLSKCNILKISDNEVEFLLGYNDYDRAAKELLEKYPNIKIMFITLGSQGSKAYTRTAMAQESAFSVKSIENTGAGDTFLGCALNYIIEHPGFEYNNYELHQLLRFANAGAALVTTKKGALKSMPTMSEICEIIKD